MKAPATIRPGPQRSFRGLMARMAVLCVMLSGCQSLQFGAALAPRAAPTDAVSPNIRLTSGVEAPPSEKFIDLPTALHLAGVENPAIGLANEAVRASVAERMVARSLLFPTLDAGMNARVHRGSLQTVTGAIIESNLQSLYYGFGSNAVGAGTVAMPGLRVSAALADAIYAPQAAQERVIQTEFIASATRNSTLMEVGVAYLALAGAQARMEAYRQSFEEVTNVERLTANYAKVGEGRESDARRARSEALLFAADMERAREEIGVASAQLARLLDVDPALQLRSADVVPPPLELVDSRIPLEALIAEALARHPEIAAAAANIRRQAVRLRLERMRPWLPVVALGFSAGEFGGGSQVTPSRLGNFNLRTDLDVVAVWSLRNAGLGNHAIQNGVRTQWEMAQTDQARLIDRIGREVAESYASIAARRQEKHLAQKRTESAGRALQQDLVRIRNLQGRPIEVLDSAKLLSSARQELIQAMIGFSQAQLQLYAALGHLPSADNVIPLNTR